MPIYSNMPEDFYPRPSDVDAPLRSPIGRGPRGPQGHSITAEIVDNDPYGYFRVRFKDAETDEVLVTTPNLDVGSRFFVYGRHLIDIVEGDRRTVNNYDFTSLQASSDRSAIRVGDIVFFTTSMTDETFLSVDTVGVGIVNSVNGTEVSFVVTNVMTAQLRDGSITTNMLADFCVTTVKLANDAVTTAKIADAAVTTSKMEDLGVTTNKLAQGSVTNAKIADNAVNTDKIIDNAITEQKITNNAVTTNKIPNQAITTAKLAEGSVTQSRMADYAVTEQKMNNGAVTNIKLASNAVTNSKIADNTISDSKLIQNSGVVNDVKYLKYMSNLFNKNGNNTTNGFYDRANVFTNSDTVRSTELIPVIKGCMYGTNSTGRTFINWYDKDKSFIAYTNKEEGEFVQTVNNACYARFIYTVSAIDTFFVLFTYETKYLINGVNVTNELNDVINLFDKNGSNTTNGFYDRTNTFVSSDTVRSTELIPVMQGCTYETNLTGATFINWYDENKSFIGYTNKAEGESVQVINDACYARFIYTTSIVDTFLIKFKNGIRDLSKHDNDFRNNFGNVINLFDKNGNNTTDGFYDRTNAFVEHDTVRSTELIPVIQGCSYGTNLTGSTFINWYDGNKDIISFSNKAEGEFVQAVDGACYARFIYTTNIVDTFFVKLKYGIRELSELANYNKISYKGLTGVAFGTSLTYRSQTTGGYLNHLQAMSGITFDNQGVGNSQIVHLQGYPDILEKIRSYTAYDNKSVCLLEGFVNDWFRDSALGDVYDTGETTACGCLRTAINYIYSQNRSIKLFLILDHYGKTTGSDCSSTAVNTAQLTQYEYYEKLAKVAESLGVIVIKEYALSGISENAPQYLLDDIHLNALGAKQSANTIWSVMKRFYPNES